MDQSQARIKPFRQVATQIRACDRSMRFAFAFARNTLTFVILVPRKLSYLGSLVSGPAPGCVEWGEAEDRPRVQLRAGV